MKKIFLTLAFVFLFSLTSQAQAGFQVVDTRLDKDPANNSSTFPKISSDNNGNVYAVWQDNRLPGTNVYFNRSTDYGQNWLSADVALGSTSAPESIKISCDNSGHVYVTWQQAASVILARSSDFGQNWASNGITGAVSQGFDFVSSQEGHLVVVWNTNNKWDLFVSYSLNHGLSWSGPVDIVAPRHYLYDVHESPRLAVDNSGHVYAVWLDNQGATGGERFVHFNHSNNFGQTWAADFSISPTENGYVAENPQVACDNSGNVSAAWLKTVHDYPNVLYFNHSENYGQYWSGVQYIDGYLDKPQLRVADNGNVYLAWNDTHDSWTKIKFQSSFDHGVSWHPAIRVTNNPINCQLGNYDFAAKGNSVYLVWENLEPWEGIYFNFSKDGGVAWQNRNGRVDNNSGDSVETNKPSISVDANENIYVAWEDARNGPNTDIYFNRADFILSLEEKIKLEADYILACQFISEGHPAHGAINDIYTPDTPPDYVVPRENGMAILGLLKARQILGEDLYLQRANLSMDYLVRVQEPDGSWKDEYDYRNPGGGLQSKSPTQPAEVMMAMYMLGFREDRYDSMKRAAQFLLDCQAHGYRQKLICGGKGDDGSFSDWNWITDNSYAYWALLIARSWALVKGENAFADECAQAAAEVLNGINLYFYKNPEWWQVVRNDGYQFNNFPNEWINFTPQFLDLPANGVGSAVLGEWIHTTFQQENGGCLWGDSHPNQEYPGISFQSAFCWLDLGQDTYAQNAITWAENSSLWQLVPDQYGISGGWVDWININDSSQRAGSWERYVDTSFYSIGSWLGGYDFTVLNNLPPVLSPIGNKTVYVNELLTFPIFAFDPEGKPLKYHASNLPFNATFDEDTHIFSWRPTSEQTGIHSVHFEVSDGFLIDSEDVAINVTRRTCFLAGTPILMADSSLKPIEKIKVGDEVMAFDERTKSLQKDKVTQLYRHEADEYLVINNNLKVTPNHLVYSKGKWVEIGNLKIGDAALNYKGASETIKSIQKFKKKTPVFNLEVNSYHSYIAGGLVAHNRKVILPFSVRNGNDSPPEGP